MKLSDGAVRAAARTSYVMLSAQYDKGPASLRYTTIQRIPAKCATFKSGSRVVSKGDVGHVVNPKARYA
jgi:hypothetical protein